MTIWTRFSPRALAVDLASCAFLGGVGDGADDEYCALVGADGGIW